MLDRFYLSRLSHVVNPLVLGDVVEEFEVETQIRYF